MVAFYVALFVISCLLLVFSGNWLVRSVSNMSRFLGLKEFTVAFLLMSFATAFPELTVGIGSALRGVPELSLGNILGQNIIHFTLAVFICILIAGSFSVKSKTTRVTAFFAGFMAFFPLVLILDGSLSRIDGFILICLFFAYTFWLLKKEKNFENQYGDLIERPVLLIQKLGLFFRNFFGFILGVAVLIIASQGIIKSAMFFAQSLNMPIVVIGVLIVGLGTSLPEIYFSANSARKRDTELMAGNLLGSTAVSTSLVLGLVSIISPINSIEIFSYFVSRLALFVSIVLFIFFMSTNRKISIREGVVLFLVYLLFIIMEAFF